MLMQYLKKTILILALLFVFVGCQTNPISGRSQFMLISEDSAIAVSREAYVNMLKPISDDGKLDNDVRSTKRVKRITELLVAQAIKYRPETAEWRWSVHVVDDPEVVNAWCMPGGKIAVYTGLLDITKNKNGLAAVMGHEVAHAVAKHSVERASRNVATNVVLQVTDILSGGKLSTVNRTTGMDTVGLLSQIGLMTPFNRTQVTVAD